MSQWLQWIILSSLTGSPVLSAVILIVGWWVVDRFTLGVLPDPVRLVVRFMKVGKLRRLLEHNPHDRKARYDLAELLVGRRQHGAAVEVLRSNLEAGDDDAPTLFLMGLACLGAGHHEQGEKLFAHAEEAEPKFRHGAIDLERGRHRLARGDFKGAREALERFCAERTGTVEGRVLLARALEGAGDDASGALKRTEAWQEYRTAPRFQRRVERLWAWRARPSRPIAYAVVLVLAAVLFARFAAPGLTQAAQGSGYQSPYGYDDEPPP
ncbi:MAG: tetratricopeptide repeat protein [Myxococcaceae bacterium]